VVRVSKTNGGHWVSGKHTGQGNAATAHAARAERTRGQRLTCTAKVAKWRCMRGVMVKLPAVGFMQAV
jgi:hypothetical protein